MTEKSTKKEIFEKKVKLISHIFEKEGLNKKSEKHFELCGRLVDDVVKDLLIQNSIKESEEEEKIGYNSILLHTLYNFEKRIRENREEN